MAAGIKEMGLLTMLLLAFRLTGVGAMKKTTANKILAAAAPLFAAYGFEHVTVDQLAKAAKVNSAAISYYFGGKGALYQLILQNQFSAALQAVQATEAGFTATAAERLLAMAAAITEIKHNQPYLTSLWHYEMNRRDAVPDLAVKEYTVQLYQRIVASLCYGISQKEFFPDQAVGSTACIILELLHAPYVPAYLLTQPIPADEGKRKGYTDQAIRNYLQGIRHVPL